MRQQELQPEIIIRAEKLTEEVQRLNEGIKSKKKDLLALTNLRAKLKDNEKYSQHASFARGLYITPDDLTRFLNKGVEEYADKIQDELDNLYLKLYHLYRPEDQGLKELNQIAKALGRTNEPEFATQPKDTVDTNNPPNQSNKPIDAELEAAKALMNNPNFVPIFIENSTWIACSKCDSHECCDMEGFCKLGNGLDSGRITRAKTAFKHCTGCLSGDKCRLLKNCQREQE